MNPYALPCGCDSAYSSCDDCRASCRTCPNDTPDLPAITVDSYVVPNTNGHVLSEPVCVDCARNSVGVIEFVEFMPWMSEGRAA